MTQHVRRIDIKEEGRHYEFEIGNGFNFGMHVTRAEAELIHKQLGELLQKKEAIKE